MVGELSAVVAKWFGDDVEVEQIKEAISDFFYRCQIVLGEMEHIPEKE